VRKSTIYLFVLALAVAMIGAIGSAGFVASAQNSNSSMTMTEKPKPKPKPRTRKPKTAATTGDTATTATPKKTGRCDPTQQEQTDLSGTYTGKAKHGTEPAQDATLTITGNNFSMTSGSETHNGRMTAVTTCGYTAVTMMMGDLTPPTPSPNPPAALLAISMRAKKMGNKLSLMSVPGEKMSVSFTPTGGAMKPKPRKHRSTTKKTEAAPAKTTP